MFLFFFNSGPVFALSVSRTAISAPLIPPVYVTFATATKTELHSWDGKCLLVLIHPTFRFAHLYIDRTERERREGEGGGGGEGCFCQDAIKNPFRMPPQPSRKKKEEENRRRRSLDPPSTSSHTWGSNTLLISPPPAPHIFRWLRRFHPRRRWDMYLGQQKRNAAFWEIKKKKNAVFFSLSCRPIPHRPIILLPKISSFPIHRWQHFWPFDAPTPSGTKFGFFHETRVEITTPKDKKEKTIRHLFAATPPFDTRPKTRNGNG